MAEVYIYLKYLLSEMPGHLDDADYSFLDDMMPWSLKYRVYEKGELEPHADEKVPESNVPSPGMKKKKKSDKAEEVA